MKHQYTATASKWKAENKNLRRHAWVDPNAKARCMERGLFQYRTEDTSEVSTKRGKRRHTKK